METNNIFDITSDPTRLRIIFNSTLENIDKADTETRKFIEELGLESETFAVSLVMREGLTNAVKHAHHYDDQKIVTYSITLESQKLIMEIEDQGEGFDWREIQKRPPDMRADHGRGIQIMKQYFNDCSFNEKGNKMTLIKKVIK